MDIVHSTIITNKIRVSVYYYWTYN